jgi:hypothetical protein
VINILNWPGKPLTSGDSEEVLGEVLCLHHASTSV